MPRFSLVANGDIFPYRFVSLDSTTDGRVVQSGAGDQIYGISQPGTRNVAYSSLDDGKAAVAGESLCIWGPPEKDVMLIVNDTVNDGDRLTSDTDGGGLPTTADNAEIGAIALAGGGAGDIIPVQLIAPQRY
jgi:hypothetical protein